jgi:hypothetical protein
MIGNLNFFVLGKRLYVSTWFRTDKQAYLEPATIVNKGGMIQVLI